MSWKQILQNYTSAELNNSKEHKNHKIFTDSRRHSVPANIAPIIAKFFPYDKALFFISSKTIRVVGVSVDIVDIGSTPAVNRPNAPPKANPK